MLIKEYRIPLPLTVEEYRIAQLYMIAKKSREESSGAGSGIEIHVNEPYSGGPGGSGQYTRKIYHVGSHLPGWIKGLLPKSALTVEEEAWNAYPYTKTRYTCPFVEKFSLEIETYYFADNGNQENVFQLSGQELRNRAVDLIDVVTDQTYAAEYVHDEDPKVFVSEKTGRGPLTDAWLAEHWAAVQGRRQPTAENRSLMCAYKLCRVEFRYWGMQTKLERFIHDTALRKTMFRAHRQAWAWQDEWHGMTMDDIRELERQTQLALQKKMGADGGACGSEGGGSDGELDEEDDGEDDGDAMGKEVTLAATRALSAEQSKHSQKMSSIEKLEDTPMFPKKLAPPDLRMHPPSVDDSGGSDEENDSDADDGRRGAVATTKAVAAKLSAAGDAKGGLHSPIGSTHSFDLQVANWRMEKLEVDSKSGSEEEFFDCLVQRSRKHADMTDTTSLAKWSSMDLLTDEDDSPPAFTNKDDTIFSHSFLQRVASERGTRRPTLGQTHSVDRSGAGCSGDSPPGSPLGAQPACPTTVLILVFHAGCVLDSVVDKTAKKSDATTFRGSFESVMRQHYPSLVGHVAVKLVCCPAVCTDALGILSSLSPYSFDTSPSTADVPQLTDVPIGAIPLLATGTADFQTAVNRTVTVANAVYADFLRSDEGRHFGGQIAVIGDSMGAVLAHDAMCRTAATAEKSAAANRHGGSEGSGLDADEQPVDVGGGYGGGGGGGGGSLASYGGYGDMDASRLLQAPASPHRHRRRSSVASDVRPAAPALPRFEFDVCDFFMFGSPLAVVLASRRLADQKIAGRKPHCTQVYNLFHPTDPVAARMEPLLSARFSMLPPINVPRYGKYPLGNGQPYHLFELIQTNPQMFNDAQPRRLSDASMQSSVSGLVDNVPLTTINALQQRWWGSKRLDYALYCPDGLSNFPAHALPHLFHASYWESTDVIAFILRQLVRFDAGGAVGGPNAVDAKDLTATFRPGQPREKWIKKRTSVKLKNVTANHRANDVIARDGQAQRLCARFMYGPLDMITLAGERVDVHVMRDPPAGEWFHIATECTDKNGRVLYTLDEANALGYGIHPVKMVVRGDHTSVDFYLAVIPARTECIVFSIDGSFTASVSVTGRDPKVRAGAVDICRHWQELGYLLVYVTGRPDMQQQRVLSWLSQHNFPHGLVSFADGLSTDPLGHKTAYLNDLVQTHGVVIHSAYGSSKDIAVYMNVGLHPRQIYIVGKVSKKLQPNANVLTEGYATHLSSLLAHGGSRPAHGNQRMVIPRGCFNLPGQMSARRRRLHETDSNASTNSSSAMQSSSTSSPIYAPK